MSQSFCIGFAWGAQETFQSHENMHVLIESKFLTLRASPPARRGQPLWKMNMVGLCVCMGWVSLAPKSWNLSLENTRKSRPKARKWGQIIVQSRFGRPQNLAKNSNATEKRRPFHRVPLFGVPFWSPFWNTGFFFRRNAAFWGIQFRVPFWGLF